MSVNSGIHPDNFVDLETVFSQFRDVLQHPKELDLAIDIKQIKANIDDNLSTQQEHLNKTIKELSCDNQKLESMHNEYLRELSRLGVECRSLESGSYELQRIVGTLERNIDETINRTKAIQQEAQEVKALISNYNNNPSLISNLKHQQQLFLQLTGIKWNFQSTRVEGIAYQPDDCKIIDLDPKLTEFELTNKIWEVLESE